MPEVTHVTDERTAWELVRAIQCADEVAWDLETRSDGDAFPQPYQPGFAITAFSAACSGPLSGAWAMPVAHPDSPLSDAQRWLSACAEALSGQAHVTHNGKYDLRALQATTGIDVSASAVWDTMVGSFLYNENQPKALKTRAPEDLGVEAWDDLSKKHMKDTATAPLDDLLEYAGLDAHYTLELARWQRRTYPLRVHRLMRRLLLPGQRPLIQMELRGMPLDVQETKQRLVEMDAKRRTAEAELRTFVSDELLGQFDPPRLFEVEEDDLSWDSGSKFFRAWAAERWPVLELTDTSASWNEIDPSKGCSADALPDNARPSWNSTVLKRLAADGYPAARKVLEHRDYAKQVSLYLSQWPDMADTTGRIHTTYNIARVVTGRLSSEKPNLQQVAKSARSCFVAPEGTVLLAADFSQIEVRVLAHLSGDENLRDVYRSRGDVYIETAANVLNKHPSDITYEERQRTKPIVLGLTYGLQPFSLKNYAFSAWGIEFTDDEAEDYYEGFFNTYPGVYTWHEKVRRFVRKHGYVSTPTGRRRHLPKAKSSDDYVRQRAERQAINARVQSFASDLTLLALMRVEPLASEGLQLVATVHDSAVALAPERRARELAERMGRVMCQPPPSWVDLPPGGLAVPLETEVEAGKRWGDYEWEIVVTS